MLREVHDANSQNFARKHMGEVAQNLCSQVRALVSVLAPVMVLLGSAQLVAPPHRSQLALLPAVYWECHH